MRKQIEMKIEVGDANYVKPGEYFAELDANNKLVSIKQRQDDLSLKEVVDTPLVLEDNKTLTKSLAALKAGDKITVTPSSGKDAMSKVTITITA